MPVRVGVRLSQWLTGSVRMLVVFIVHVGVAMLEWLVLMRMLVPLAQVEPEAKRHERGRRDEQRCHWFAVKKEPEHGSNEWREREICSGPGCSQRPQGKHEAYEAHAIAQESHQQGSREGKRFG
jgi:hypothetical protein